jgi:hypothetical protein
MALLDYAEVRPWAKAIKEETLERRMPPAGAVPGFGGFVNDYSVSQEEIHIIADWVEGGAPEGDPAFLPARPKPPAGDRVTAEVLLGDTLSRAVTLHAIRAEGLAKGASLRVLAATPAGETIPLVWLHNHQPKWARTFRYREPVRLPAGTRIVRTAPARVLVRTTPVR